MNKTFIAICIVIYLFLATAVSAKCSRPVYYDDVNYSTRLCGENFVLERGLSISRDNVNIDCSSAVLKGNLFSKNIGIIIEDRQNISLRNCRIVNYDVGVLVRNSSNIFLGEITFLRNKVGIKLFDSFNVNVANGFDISLTKPVHVSSSSMNSFSYFNKRIKGDFCAHNLCK